MQIHTDSHELKTALKRMKPFTDARPHIPVLDYVKLAGCDGRLNITCANGERCGNEPSMTTFTIMTSYEPEYSVLVKYKDLRKIADKLNREIVLDVDGSTLRIESGKLSFTLKGKPASEFPVLASEPGPIEASSAPSYRDLGD